MIWKGIATDGSSARLATPRLPSVRQSPVGMKQNCSEPDNRIVRSTSERTSSMDRPPCGRSGFSIKRLGRAVKDSFSIAAYREALHTPTATGGYHDATCNRQACDPDDQRDRFR